MKKYFTRFTAAAAGSSPLLAFADDTPIQTVTASVESAMTGGLAIATAIVVGLFAIYGVKLLWRAK